MSKMRMVRKTAISLANIRSRMAFKNPTIVNSDFIKDQRIKCVGKIDMRRVIVSPPSTPLSPRSNLLKLARNILIVK